MYTSTYAVFTDKSLIKQLSSEVIRCRDELSEEFPLCTFMDWRFFHLSVHSTEEIRGHSEQEHHDVLSKRTKHLVVLVTEMLVVELLSFVFLSLSTSHGEGRSCYFLNKPPAPGRCFGRQPLHGGDTHPTRASSFYPGSQKVFFFEISLVVQSSRRKGCTPHPPIALGGLWGLSDIFPLRTWCCQCPRSYTTHWSSISITQGIKSPQLISSRFRRQASLMFLT